MFGILKLTGDQATEGNLNSIIMAHKAIDDHVEGQQPGNATLGMNPENASEFCEASDQHQYMLRFTKRRLNLLTFNTIATKAKQRRRMQRRMKLVRTR